MSMNIQRAPDTLTKLTQLGEVTLYEPAGDQPQNERTQPAKHSRAVDFSNCITHVQTPRGAKPILKTMVTTACERNCYYCPFRAGRGSTQRVTFKPDELAKAVVTLSQANKVQGMFLSSGIIKGSITTQDKILDTAEILRHKMKYRGYLHLKIMPGAERDQIYRAMQLADRISVNLEGATQERLARLAPKKEFTRELVNMLYMAEQLRRENPHQKLASMVTQFVVGAVGDTDVELLTLSDQLYQHLHLSRVYYSPFSPVIQTPFENLPAVDRRREHRLYQASFLLRDYGWSSEELPYLDAGNLPLDIDPKKAWAQENLTHQPIELMTADRAELLRIPNIGPKGADQILKARQQGTLTSLNDLRKLGIRATEQVAPYVLLDGKRPLVQGRLF